MNELLDAAAAQSTADPGLVLSQHAWLGQAMDADATADRFRLWGRSTVIDENTGAPVVNPAQFEALHARVGIDAHWPVGNAGVLHVYGYLLSTAPTPYGLKRARWLDGDLARAYGLAGDAFLPWTGTRTLLERVTEAAGGLLAGDATRTVEVAGVATTVALSRAADAGPWALAYAVDGRIVTTFPVDSPETVLAEWDSAPARLHYNAVP